VSEGPRVLVGAVGLAGHALPAIALARALGDRGAGVVVATSERWRPLLAELGLGAAPRSDYFAVPGDEQHPGKDAALAASVRGLLPMLREAKPDVVVSDGLTAAPALAAEIARVPCATLFPEVYPVHGSRLPPFASGLYPPRTPVGAAAWSAGQPLRRLLPGARAARRAFNREREELGLEPEPGFHGTLSDDLTLVATFPQLEYPRRWPGHVHVTGPMMLDPSDVEVELPGGDEPVRVLVTMGGAGELNGPVPANAVVADWVSYGRVMPLASAVVCNGNHGTVAWALAHGAPVLVSPAMADDAEHGARVGWSGAGLMVPGWLLRPGPVRLAMRQLLDDPAFRVRAREIAAWSSANDGAARGAELVEGLAR